MAKKPGLLYIFTMVMTLMYIGIGFYLIFADSAEEMLPGWKHTALGIMLFVYAAYRIIRLRKLQQQIENENASD